MNRIKVRDWQELPSKIVGVINALWLLRHYQQSQESYLYQHNKILEVMGKYYPEDSEIENKYIDALKALTILFDAITHEIEKSEKE